MNKKDKPIYVSSPLMPDYEEFTEALRPLWESRMLTNNGTYLRELERAIGNYLNEEYVSVYTNGTLPIMAACHALELTAEVITTPYTFIATSHALKWCGLEPVFVDIDPATGNLDPSKIEAAITEKTSAILPVHVYGQPCDVDSIKRIADKHGLPVIYDAAHAFGVRRDGISVTAFGDLVTLSFHATKVFNTLEGGAIISRTPEMKEKLDRLRNFGFESETEITAVGINAKMDEMRAIFGLHSLRRVNEAIEHRKELALEYNKLLNVPNLITTPEYHENIHYNYSHYPILLRDKKMRENIYNSLKSCNIFPRRYFYPVVTAFPPYDQCPGASEIPNAQSMSERVLCLPIHTSIDSSIVKKISEIILKTIYSNS